MKKFILVIALAVMVITGVVLSQVDHTNPTKIPYKNGLYSGSYDPNYHAGGGDW